MVAVLIAFPLLMLGTLVYVALAAHEETPIASTGAGQTGCVQCSKKREGRAIVNEVSKDRAEINRESELIAA